MWRVVGDIPTAVLARLAETVVGLEQKDLGLAEKATDALNAIETDNAAVVEGELSKGVPGQGPFNVIIVNGAVAEPAQAWIDQLSVGGRLAVIVRDGSCRPGAYLHQGAEYCG
jgi:protein-L-isoaspartate(D-aspartate) O-methyltransferase